MSPYTGARFSAGVAAHIYRAILFCSSKFQWNRGHGLTYQLDELGDRLQKGFGGKDVFALVCPGCGYPWFAWGQVGVVDILALQAHGI